MRNYLRQCAGAEVLRLRAHIHAARNAALASSRLSATPPVRAVRPLKYPTALGLHWHTSQPVLRIPLRRGTQIGLR